MITPTAKQGRVEAIAKAVHAIWHDAAMGGTPTIKDVDQHLAAYPVAAACQANAVIASDPLTALAAEMREALDYISHNTSDDYMRDRARKAIARYDALQVRT